MSCFYERGNEPLGSLKLEGGDFLNNWETIGFSRRTLWYGVSDSPITYAEVYHML